MLKKLNGIIIGTEMIWDIEGKYDFPSLFRAIPALFPKDSTLYFEGTSIDKKVIDILEKFPALTITEVYLGTIAPKPKKFHVTMNSKLLAELTALTENLAEPEVCDHFCIYQNSKILLSGYDFGSLPLSIADIFPEDLIRRFSEKLNCKYKYRKLKT